MTGDTGFVTKDHQ